MGMKLLFTVLFLLLSFYEYHSDSDSVDYPDPLLGATFYAALQSISINVRSTKGIPLKVEDISAYPLMLDLTSVATKTDDKKDERGDTEDTEDDGGDDLFTEVYPAGSTIGGKKRKTVSVRSVENDFTVSMLYGQVWIGFPCIMLYAHLCLTGFAPLERSGNSVGQFFDIKSPTDG